MMESYVSLLLAIGLCFFTTASGFYVQPQVVTFTASPSSLLVSEGGRVELICAVLKQNMLTATSLPHPEIHWMLNGTLISESPLLGAAVVTDISTSTHVSQQLVIPAASAASEGWYQCRATDGHNVARCGGVATLPCVRTDVLSDRAWLQVIGNITRSEVLAVPVFSSVLLQCGSQLVPARGWNGTRIVWTRNGTDLESGSNEFVLSSGDLMVYSDSGSGGNTTYSCIVHLGDTAILYREYWLDVSESHDFDTFPMSSSVPSVHTASPVATAGETVELTCSFLSSNSTLDSPFPVSWVLRGAGGGDSAVSTSLVRHLRGHVLVLERVSLEDGGTFCCEIGSGPRREDCVTVNIMEEGIFTPPDPTQLFVNSRESIGTHNVNIMCPLHAPSLPTTWYRNGMELANSSERNLMRTDSEAVLLYGVYQCLVGSTLDPYQQIPNMWRNAVINVARVMPYGISNPPGEIFVSEQPWPNKTAVTAALLYWTAPNYTGNLSSLRYKISYPNVDSFSNETQLLTYLGDLRYDMTLSVHDSMLGALSDETSTSFEVDTTCEYEVLFPPLPSLSCEMGSPQLTLLFDSESNDVYRGFDNYDLPRVNYLQGGCRDAEPSDAIVYEAFPNISYGNQVTFGEGMMTFAAGSWCILHAASTLRPDSQNPSRLRCYDPTRLYYSGFEDCVIRATVSFVSAEYLVNEEAGSVEVCVQARGYGFTVDLTVSDITVSESDYNHTSQYQLNFSAPVVTTQQCVHIAIYDDAILEANESMRLTMGSSNRYVLFQTAVSDVTIVDNDNILVRFLPDRISTGESRGNVTACIEVAGELERSISVNVNSGDTGFPPNETVVVPPGRDYLWCFDIVITDDDALEEDEELTWSLSSVDEGVRLGSRNLTILILDDDNVTVRFINATTLSPVTMYSVHENEEVLSVCVEVVGVSRKDVSLTLSTLDDTATGGTDFMPATEDIHFSQPFSAPVNSCHNITLLHNRLAGNPETKVFKLHLDSATTGVVLPPEDQTVLVIDDDPEMLERSPFLTVALSVAGVSLVVVIATAMLVILLVRKKRYSQPPGKMEVILTGKDAETVTHNDYDPLVNIILDLDPCHNHFDPTETSISHTFPLTHSSGNTMLDGEKVSKEFEMAPKNSSSLLLEYPQAKIMRRRKDNVSDSSSGYLNFETMPNESGNVSIGNHSGGTSVLSRDDLRLLGSSASSREGTCSPESHVLSTGGNTAGDCPTRSSESSQEDLHQPVCEPTTLERISPSHNNGSKCVDLSPNLSSSSPPPVSKSNRQQEDDSGFPGSDSGYPLPDEESSSLEKGLVEGGSFKLECGSLVQDSGCPLDDSCSPADAYNSRLPFKESGFKV